jgi:hypothetical protein
MPLVHAMLLVLLVTVLAPVCILIAIWSCIELAVVLLFCGWEKAKIFGEPNPDLARKAVFLMLYLTDDDNDRRFPTGETERCG